MKNIFFVTYIWMLLLVTPAVAGNSSRIYVLNMKSDFVSIIDPTTNKVVAKIEGIPGAHGAVFSPDGTRAYITSEVTNMMYEVDTHSLQILRKVAMSKGAANLPAITKDGDKIFVCVNGTRDAFGFVQGRAGGWLDVVDTKSFQVKNSLKTSFGLHDCYTTPDGKYAIATSFGMFIMAVDTKTEEKVWQIDLDKAVTTSAQELAKDGSTKRLFSCLSDFSGFAVIDFPAHKEVARIALPAQPSGVLVPEDLRRRNHIPTHGSEISPDGKTLWIVSRGANGAFVYSLPELKVIKFIPTARVKGAPITAEAGDGGDPGWITFTPDGKMAYIPNGATNSVSAIDTKSMKVIAEIPVGNQPDHIHTLVLPNKK